MPRTKGSKDYRPEIKMQAVKMYLEDGMTQSAITARLGIHDPGRVRQWLRAYRLEGEQAFSPEHRRRSGRRPKPQDEKAYIAKLEMEVELLKKFHSEARRCPADK
jgi:transposase-like protein